VLIQGADAKVLASIFGDDKTAKQIANAAKRAGKKRAAGPSAEQLPAAKKKRAHQSPTPQDEEAALALPAAITDEAALRAAVLTTNRAPLVLAFAVAVLQYTMSAQPLSSRLSLAQALVALNSRSKAVSLGIEGGASAEEEGWGTGRKGVKVLGREVRVLRRIGWRAQSGGESKDEEGGEGEALWGLDLEALRKSSGVDVKDGTGVASSYQLPIHTPQSARNYLLKAFDSAPASAAPSTSTKSPTKASTTRAEKEHNLALLLGALHLLFASWSPTLDADELDRRAWGWYVRVRPVVPDGVSGWGARGAVRLADILDLRRQSVPAADAGGA
jgi:hypothetical protein